MICSQKMVICQATENKFVRHIINISLLETYTFSKWMKKNTILIQVLQKHYNSKKIKFVKTNFKQEVSIVHLFFFFKIRILYENKVLFSLSFLWNWSKTSIFRVYSQAQINTLYSSTKSQQFAKNSQKIEHS